MINMWGNVIRVCVCIFVYDLFIQALSFDLGNNMDS